MNLDLRLLSLTRSSRFILFLTILFGFLGGVFTVVQASLLSRTIGAVFLGGKGLPGASGLLVTLLGVMALRAALAWSSEVAANEVAVQIKGSLRERLYSHLQGLGPGYVRGERTGELVSVAVEGIEALDAYFSQYLPQIFLAGLVPLTFLFLIFPLDPLSALVLLITAPLIPLFMVLIGSRAESMTRSQWQTLSRLSAHFLDVMQGLATLKLLGRSRSQVEVIAQIGERYREQTMEVLRITFLSALALELISTLSTAVVAVEIGLRLLYGRLDFEQAFFVLILAPEFYLPLRSLGLRFHAGMAGVAAVGRIFEILDRTAEEGRWTTDDGRKTKEEAVVDGISFEEVHYAYPGNRHALRGVSFRIQAGKRVALVGPSGAGKSTVAALLLRFGEPASGMIRVDGIPLSAIPANSWREQVAWVPQIPYLFNGTVAENIRLGRPEASLEDVIVAAGLANADGFIQQLSAGYDTAIGERGARLSGGQAQRLALARAFLVDAPVLILDEATANLDPELEDLVREALDRLMEGRTVLIIAHRLNTIRQADEIVVLEDGRVAETGSHTELISKNKSYARLVKSYRAGLDDRETLNGSERQAELALQQAEVKLQRSPGPTRGFTSAGRSEAAALPHLAYLMRLLGLLAPYKSQVALSALLGFATIASSIGLMSLSASIIARAALQPSIAELQIAITGVRFFGLTRGVCRYLERYVSHQVTFHLLARLRTWFYSALEPLAPARLIPYQGGDLLSRAIGDIASLENFYVRALAPPLVAVLVAAGMSLFLSWYHPSLAAGLAAFLVLAGVGVPMLTHRLSQGVNRRSLAERATLSAALVDGIQGMADLLAFGGGRRQMSKIKAVSQAFARSQREMARLGALNGSLENLLANLGMWSVLVLAIPLVRSGQIDGPSLAVVVLAALTSFEAVLPLPASAQHLAGNLEAARRLYELVDSEPEVRDPVEPLSMPSSRPRSAASAATAAHPFDIEVRKLSFGYTAQVLKELNFSVPFGRRLAIVGPSGAGKSTLVNLLLRFWEYGEGEITLGGHDLRKYSQEEVRRNMAVVSQNTTLFNATLRENLLLAQPKAREEELVRAAQCAQIHDFIQSLPEGYDTWIGEQGLRLSGGERQRLAMARAFLKAAPIFILDEPSANLDALTEREILHTLLSMEGERTLLLITHRLAELEALDEIIVLRQGRIVEQGKHAQLLERRGMYWRMWVAQNQVLGGDS